MQHSETPRKRLSRSASALAAASMLVMSMIGGAQAATTDLSLGPFDIAVNKFSNSPFTDVYDFSFGTQPGGTISASAIEIKLGKFVDIAWNAQQAFSVYSGPGGSGTLLASFGDPGVSTGSFFVEDLPVGNNLFSLVLKGTAVGTGTSAFQPGLKGHYDLNVMAQPIPEPASMALMLVSLCGVAGTARMKKRGLKGDDPVISGVGASGPVLEPVHQGEVSPAV